MFKPFSKMEMKMLIFNKVKRGMSYTDACKELSAELKIMNKNAFVKSSAKTKEEGGEVNSDFSYPPSTP